MGMRNMWQERQIRPSVTHNAARLASQNLARSQTHDPEPLALQRELRENETRRQRRQIERAGSQVQIANQMHPERIGQLLGEVPQIDDINGQQSEQHERLPPLGGVPPKHARVLDQQRHFIGGAVVEETRGSLHRTGVEIELGAALAPMAEPAPAHEEALTALHDGEALVKEFSRAGEGEIPEEKHVAQQHQQKESGRHRRALGPLQHAGGKPVARQPRPFGEMGAGQQFVQGGQHAGVG
jgi:hypothetical protein